MIKPQLPSGFKDYLPDEMILRNKILDTIRASFELFGFLPLETPEVERLEILTGGDPNFTKQIYLVKKSGSKEETDIALRFDLTVALARAYAQYRNEIGGLFKRYQLGRVFRGERPQKGRFNGFYQFDIDTVGSKDMTADAEIVAVIYSTMTKLGVDDFIIKINNRKILNALPEFAGFENDLNTDVLRVIDKLDKQSWDSVSGELTTMGISIDAVGAIKRFLDIPRGNEEALDAVFDLVKDSENALQGIKELREIAENLTALGVPKEKWAFDFSVARGLGYYTGPVFETMLTKLPSIGSVFSGGRYDDLVSKFSTISVPAVGASIGVDRLFDALKELRMTKKEKSIAKILVLNFENNPKARIYVQEITSLLRANNIPTELYLGKEKGMGGQLKYAEKLEMQYAIIAGMSEVEKNVVQFKDTVNRTQQEVDKSEIVDKVRSVISS
ncbi:MAG: histidine--tRNA ligase [Patescibacteria group bacterium]